MVAVWWVRPIRSQQNEIKKSADCANGVCSDRCRQRKLSLSGSVVTCRSRSNQPAIASGGAIHPVRRTGLSTEHCRAARIAAPPTTSLYRDQSLLIAALASVVIWRRTSSNLSRTGSMSCPSGNPEMISSNKPCTSSLNSPCGRM